MAEVIERLDVTHNFVTIDSPIKFFIQMNEDIKHRVLKSAQAIQIDCRKLLTRKDMPNIPAWALFIVYDDSLLAEGEKVNWYAHDVDFAGSTDSVNGVLVDVDLSALYAELQANNDSLIQAISAPPRYTDYLYAIRGNALMAEFKRVYGVNVRVNFSTDFFYYESSGNNEIERLFARDFLASAYIQSDSINMQFYGDCIYSVGGADYAGKISASYAIGIFNSSNKFYTFRNIFGLEL